MSLALGAICGVTHTVSDLARFEHAYTQYLGMRVQARGLVDRASAESWGAPLCAGCPMLVLAFERGEETWLRFIEDPDAGTCEAFVSHGWNATEITVQDTDELARRLDGSPFRIIGAPCNLAGFDWIRAMQVIGPAGECLYLTDVGGDTGLAAARAMVGQVFIAVAGGSDIGAMTAFYRDGFQNLVTDPVQIPIRVINAAHGLPPGTRHDLALVELPGGTRIELDHYPSAATARPVRPGHLPPGMSVVSFYADRLRDWDLAADPSTATMPAYVGPPAESWRTACLRGAAGELIELCFARA